MQASMSRPSWLAVAFLLLLPDLAVAASVTIVLPPIQGRTGEEIKVPITVQDPNRLAAFETFVLYDPAGLEPTSNAPAESSELTQNSQFEGEVIAPGRLRIRLAQADALKGPGPLFTIAFRVQDEQALKPLRLEGARALAEDLSDLAVVVAGDSGAQTSDITRLLQAMLSVLLAVGVLLVLLRTGQLLDRAV